MSCDDPRYSYNSDGDTTQGSINFQHESTSQVNRLEDGTIEITDTLPKKEYYMTLRKNARSLGGSMNRVGAGSTAGFGTMSGTLRSGFLNSKSQSIIDFKPSGKMMECVIVMLDGTEESLMIDKESYGQHLFDMVCEHLELNEREYFGITYKDKGKVWYWLDWSKKITKQVPESRLLFEFQVKFYPPNIDMIVEELTRYYFSLQVRQDIITGELPCSFNIYAILGAYVIQSEAGDFDGKNHRGIEYLRDQPLSPQNFQTDELLYRVSELHKQHRGQSPEEADKLFLENARRLALYGVDRHKVKNTEREELTFGVFHGGILLYRQKIRVIHFSWARLIKVSYKKNKVKITVRGVTKMDSKKELTFKSADIKLAKRLYKAVVDHHYFFRMIEMRLPKKPNLQPGFATRKYYKQPQSASPSSTRDFSFDNQPPPKIKRLPPSRKEQAEDGWFTLPSNNGSVTKREITSSPLATMNHDISPLVHRHSNIQVRNKPSTQDNLRPMLSPLYWRMSPADCTLSIGMDEKGLDVASQPNTGWQGCRSNKGVKTPGEYFYEARVLEDGLVRIGWSSNDASLSLGTDDKGYGYGADESGAGWGDNTIGRILHSNNSKEYGSGVTLGDYIGCRINLNNGDTAFYKNGKPMNIACKIPEKMRRDGVFPTLSVMDGRVDFNFGDSAFVFPPSDSETWIPICQAEEANQIPNKYIGWKLNAYDSTNGIDVSADGLMAQSQLNQGWQGSKCNKGVKGRGKYYYEASPMENGGFTRVGWATDTGSLDLGTDKFGFGYGADPDGFGLNGNQGKKMFKNDIENYGKAINKGDIIGCMLNLDDGNVQWALNGEIYSSAYDIPLELRNGPSAFFPTISLKNNTIDMNFGEKVFKNFPGTDWTPLTYAPEQFMKESRKRGPERKVKGLSYLNMEDNDNFTDTKSPQHSDISSSMSNPIRLPILISPVIEDKNDLSFEEAVLVNKSGSRTVTNGEVTEVATNEPLVETETYYDEDGNLVRRTVTKTRKITKTTKTMSELVTERSENDIATTKTNRIDKRISKPRNEDLEDAELMKAIMSVTRMDSKAAVLNDFVGSLGFVTNSKESTQALVESEL